MSTETLAPAAHEPEARAAAPLIVEIEEHSGLLGPLVEIRVAERLPVLYSLGEVEALHATLGAFLAERARYALESDLLEHSSLPSCITITLG
jgi:hypothetical protein